MNKVKRLTELYYEKGLLDVVQNCFSEGLQGTTSMISSRKEESLTCLWYKATSLWTRIKNLNQVTAIAIMSSSRIVAKLDVLIFFDDVAT